MIEKKKEELKRGKSSFMQKEEINRIISSWLHTNFLPEQTKKIVIVVGSIKKERVRVSLYF